MQKLGYEYKKLLYIRRKKRGIIIAGQKVLIDFILFILFLSAAVLQQTPPSKRNFDQDKTYKQIISGNTVLVKGHDSIRAGLQGVDPALQRDVERSE